MPNSIHQAPIFLLFKFKGYLVSRMWKQLLEVSALTLGLWFIKYFDYYHFEGNLAVPGLMGAALGILLVFRNNTAYERWWEARKVLGALVNTSRNIALQVNHLIGSTDEKKELMTLTVAFCYALKEHLRTGVNFDEIQFLKEEDIKRLHEFNHVPNGIADQMLRVIKSAKDKGDLSDYQMIQLIKDVDDLIIILGKCERIHNTPIPAAHNYLLRLYIMVYTIAMPFGFIGTMGIWAIPAVVFIYYLAMGIVTIAEEIEDPFGLDPNDLPVDKIVGNIHKNVKEIYERSNEEDFSYA